MIRGQVSFFIIIGILIVLLTATLLFLYIPDGTVSTPPEFHELEIILRSCSEEALNDGIIRGSLLGGHPELARVLDGIRESDIPLLASQPIAFTNNHEPVPYWTYYKMACHDDCVMTMKPKITGFFSRRTYSYDSNDMSVEAQLSRYSSSIARDCVIERIADDDTFSLDSIDVMMNIILSDNNLQYETRMTGSISRGSATISSLQSRGSFDTSFKRLYDAASKISAMESGTGFSSFLIMDIISLDNSPKGRYPPMWALDMSYSINSWTSRQVSEMLYEDITNYFSFVRLSDSSLLSSDDSLIPYELRRTIMDIRDDGTPVGDDMILTHLPSYAAPTVSFRGRSIVMGETLSIPMDLIASIIPLRSYRTYYDINTPTIYELRSKTDGLVFRFAVESVIKSNMPVYDTSLAPVTAGDYISDDFPDIHALSMAYCDSPQGSLVSFDVIDGSTGSAVSDAMISFACEQEFCSYAYDSSPIRLPVCMNADITVHHDSLAFGTVSLDTVDYDIPKSALLIGYEASTVPVDIRLLPLSLIRNDPYYSTTGIAPRTLQGEEYAIILLRNIDTESQHATIVTRHGMSQELLLTPGFHTLDIMVLRDIELSTVTIPEDNRCTVSLFGGPCLIGSYTIDRVDLEDTLVLSSVSFGEHEPIYIPPAIATVPHTVNMIVPIVDLQSISQSNRIIEHLSVMGDMDYIMRSEGFVEVS